MSQLSIPTLTRQSLSSALYYIASQTNNGKLSLQIEASLHDALRNGELVIIAEFITENGSSQRKIPVKFFRKLDGNELAKFCQNSGNYRDNRRIDDDTPQYRNATVATVEINAWLSTSNAVEDIGDNQMPHIITNNQTYITYTQAVSWVVFRDFDKLAVILHTDTQSRWPINSYEQKPSLLKGLKAISRKEKWTGPEWANEVNITKHTNTGYSMCGVIYEKVLEFVHNSDEPLAQLIAELSEEIATDIKEYNAESAERDLLELFRDKKIELFGRRNGNGTSIPVPADVLRLSNLCFDLVGNKIYEDVLFVRDAIWTELKVDRKQLVYEFKDSQTLHYSKKVLDDDYNYIRDGKIRAHMLAALWCDLSPIGNISAESFEAKSYNNDLASRDNPLGRIFDYIKHAIDFKKGVVAKKERDHEHTAINFGKMVAWLQTQPNAQPYPQMRQYLDSIPMSIASPQKTGEIPQVIIDFVKNYSGKNFDLVTEIANKEEFKLWRQCFIGNNGKPSVNTAWFRIVKKFVETPGITKPGRRYGT